MSVPQMAERRTLIRTSLCPTDGSGTSCSQMPGSARAFSRAFLDCSLMYHGKFASSRRECLNDLIELRARVRSAHLGANSRFSMGNHRKGESHDVNSLRLYALREFDRQRCVAQHDRDDGMFARNQTETQTLHLFAEVT